MAAHTGKIVMVTGANSGIGKAVAAAFAGSGATVVMVCRSRERGEAARADIAAKSGSANVELMVADLASMAAVRELAAAFKAKHDRLHLLVNNAAVYTQSRTLTPDGLETMFATNYLAYFLLTALLLDTLKASAPSAVFNVTAPVTNPLDFDDLQGEKSFSALNAFGKSKMGNLLFSFALARRLAGTGVRVNAYHPGIVRTGLMRSAAFPLSLFTGLVNRFGATPERAAAGLVHRFDETDGGSGQLLTAKKTLDAAPYARDEAVQERLWAVSRELTGLA